MRTLDELDECCIMYKTFILADAFKVAVNIYNWQCITYQLNFYFNSLSFFPRFYKFEREDTLNLNPQTPLFIFLLNLL